MASLEVKHGFLALWLLYLQHLGSVAVAPRLQSTGSVFVALGLNCSVGYRILPEQGSNLCLLH